MRSVHVCPCQIDPRIERDVGQCRLFRQPGGFRQIDNGGLPPNADPLGPAQLQQRAGARSAGAAIGKSLESGFDRDA
jgi:hypothetical protein